jgi:glycosyltransferase involved in cell wall biosynthesis
MHCYYDDSPIFKKLQKKIWDLLIENQLLSHVHSLILPSLFWRDYLLNRDIPLDNLTIIPNCVSLSNLLLGASAQEKNELTDLAGFPSLLYVGRLDPVKRVEDLILALKEDGMSGGVLHVVGIGPSLKFLKDFAKKCRVEDRVIFYGFVEDSGVQNLVDKVDIFVLPSLQEGMPTVLMEMILRRCRVVASSIPGNLSVLNPLELKTVFTVGNIKSLRDAILGCMSTSISDDQVKKAKELFTWEENIHKIEAIYDRLLIPENQSA